jgi:hypothetical protein
MAKLISKAEKILKKLKKEGKVQEIEIDWTKINKEMEEVMRESRRKQAASWAAAKDVLLD